MKKLLSILLAAVLFLFVTTNPNDYPDYTPPQTGIEQQDDITADNGTEENEQVSPCDDSGAPPPGGDTQT